MPTGADVTGKVSVALYRYVGDVNGATDVFGLEECLSALSAQYLKPGYSFKRPNGSAVDPGLDDFVTDLQSGGVGIKGVNLEIADSNGFVVGEIDVLTDNAAIQYKHGASSGPAISKQISQNTEPFVTVPVVGFIKGAGGRQRAAAVSVRKSGYNHMVTDNLQDLIDVIK